jgi:hypothetical protein
MTVFRTALTLELLPGRRQPYLEWLAGSMAVLGPVYERTGIREKVVVMAGEKLIAHYEADRPGAVEAAFAEPEALELLAGPLSQLLDPSVGPRFYPGVLAWTMPVTYAPRHVALMLDTKAGRDGAYVDYVREHFVRQFEAVWRRHELARKEVLVSGESVIAYYGCRDSASVFATFGEPEAIAALKSELGSLIELDPTRPPEVFEEVFAWRAGGAKPATR